MAKSRLSARQYYSYYYYSCKNYTIVNTYYYLSSL